MAGQKKQQSPQLTRIQTGVHEHRKIPLKEVTDEVTSPFQGQPVIRRHERLGKSASKPQLRLLGRTRRLLPRLLVVVHRLLGSGSGGGCNGAGRLRNVLSFLRQAWIAGPRWAREFLPDVVIASSTYPMDFWVARRIARRAGARLVHEVHDLWPLSPIELSGMSPRHPFARWCQAAEDAACRQADLVVSMLPRVHGHLAAHALGFLNEVNAEDLQENAARDYRPGERIGRSGLEQAWESILRGRRGWVRLETRQVLILDVERLGRRAR
jgi:hypothetical protein